ncbi:MAG: heavy metal-binding domain-containing protein, partial [Vicinamibacterales bacterium]
QQQDLPPVSYICPMDGDVLETEPGKCPICKMALEPVRIDTAWSCPNHAAVIRDKPGACPIDKRELVQVIVAKYWTCNDNPKVKLPDPGKCQDGSPRRMKTELRAHGDHNPRYGGSFFMAEDKWHHLEGTYPSAGLFRMYFFDNFTKPLAPGKFSGRVILEEKGKEIASFPMAASRDGKTLDARVKGLPDEPSKSTPVKLVAKIKFDAKTPEQRFDFIFVEYSKVPPSQPPAQAAKPTPTRIDKPATAAPKPAAAAAPARPAATPAAAAAAAPVAPPPSPPPAPPSAPSAPAAAPAAPASAAASPTDDVGALVPQTTSALTLSRNDAAQLVDNLPTSPEALLDLLEQRTKEVEQAITDGQFGYIYIPALLSKDIALALGDQVTQLPDRQRPQASAAVRRIVVAAWNLDFYGDLGNRQKITDAFDTFAAAFADLKAAYGTSR